jgi:hypothetical protein
MSTKIDPRIADIVWAEPVVAPCRMVMFHHKADMADYPAIILQVREDGTTIEVIGEDGETTVKTVPVVNLMVLRPRAIEWTWSMQGENGGQWSWPVIK